MRFENSQLLWLLLVLPPALIGFFWWAWRHRQKLLTQFIQARLLPGLTTGISPTRQKIRMGCIVLAVVLLIFALARPQWGFTLEESKQIGLDIVVAIDTSKSMLAADITPNRLGRAKLAALDLMQQAKSDRLGLVAFAGDAFLQCPLTIDDTAFRQSVQALDVNTIPRGGTALASAIKTALAAFKEGDNYKALVLITDGEDNDEGALEAAQAAAKEGLIIFTIGVGTPEGQFVQVTDAQGQTDFVRDEQGNVIKSHLNEGLLQQIAAATKGGFYLPLRGAKTMDTLYERGLAPLPKSEQGSRVVRQYNEHFHWPLGAAMVVLIVEMLLPERKRHRAEAAAGNATATLRGAAVAMVLVVSVISGMASPSEAQRDYQSGKFDAALKEYQHELEKKGEDTTLHYDAGAAAYRDKQYNEAAKQFGQAINAQDLKVQEKAYYNLGNSLYRAGEEEQDDQKRKQSWEDAVRQFQNTMALNPADQDAKHNLEFVKKKLEELKQQQQQQNQQNRQNQNQQDQDQQQANNQKNQQNQQQKDQQNQQQQSQQKNQQQQQQSQNQSGQQKNQSQQNQQQAQNQQGQQQRDQQGQEEQKKQAQEKQAAEEKQKQEQAKAGEKPEDEKPDGQQDAEQAKAQGEMTPQEARRLMDAQKGDEQILQWNAEKHKPEDNNTKPVKDW